MQKRMLVMLLKAEKDPAKLAEFIEMLSLEMEDEDVSHVRQKLG